MFPYAWDGNNVTEQIIVLQNAIFSCLCRTPFCWSLIHEILNYDVCRRVQWCVTHAEYQKHQGLSKWRHCISNNTNLHPITQECECCTQYRRFLNTSEIFTSFWISSTLKRPIRNTWPIGQGFYNYHGNM